MYAITIPVPPLKEEQIIEVEVKINEDSKHFNYRVETFEWRHFQSSDDRVDGLKAYIEAYDNAWQLVEIGAPTKSLIPLMFRQK
jgi:hypothetical protein